MRRQKAKVRSRPASDDLPTQLDFAKLKFVGFGLDALDRYEAEKGRTVVLDQDVAAVFGSADAVNAVLRAIIESAALSPKAKRRKSA